MNYELRIMSFVVAMLLGVAGAFAQDIITLKSGDDIEALVEKVGETEIEYKRWDNQTGPVYVVKTDKIFMINYRNGTKQVFNTPAKPSQPQTEQVQQQPVTPVTPSPTDLKTEFYRIGNDDWDMLDFFERNGFSVYYERFRNARKQSNSGKALLGVGIGLSGVSVIVWVAGGSNGNESVRADSYIAGSILSGVGSILTIIGIPVTAVGGGRKKSIKNDFAREQFGVMRYSYQPKLNFSTTSNGIGLTLNF